MNSHISSFKSQATLKSMAVSLGAPSLPRTRGEKEKQKGQKTHTHTESEVGRDLSWNCLVSVQQVAMGEAPKARDEHAEHERRARPPPHYLAQEKQQQQRRQQRQGAPATSFHITRPMNPISTVISAPPLHHASVVLGDPFHVSRILFQADKSQVWQLSLEDKMCSILC